MPFCWFCREAAQIKVGSFLCYLGQEEFLDLPMSVSGSDGIEDSLKASYLEFEIMEGKNQYRCGKCNKLVDAKKVYFLA